MNFIKIKTVVKLYTIAQRATNVCVCVCVGSVIKMMYKLNFFQMDEAKRERDHLRAAMANTEDDSDRKNKQQKWRKMMYI